MQITGKNTPIKKVICGTDGHFIWELGKNLKSLYDSQKSDCSSITGSSKIKKLPTQKTFRDYSIMISKRQIQELHPTFERWPYDGTFDFYF